MRVIRAISPAVKQVGPEAAKKISATVYGHAGIKGCLENYNMCANRRKHDGPLHVLG
jgi:hypothetical protein